MTLTLSGRFSGLGLGITSRVLLLIATPLVAMLGVSGMLLNERQQDAVSLGHVVQVSGLTREVGALADELQKERDATAIVLGSGGRRYKAELAAQRVRVTALFDQFLRADHSALAPDGSALATKLAAVRADLMLLAPLRRRVDGLAVPAAESFAAYSSTVGDLLALVPETGAIVSDPASGRAFLALFDLMQAHERASQERGLGAQALAAGGFTPDLSRSFATLKDEQDSFLHIFSAYATPAQQRSLAAALSERQSLDFEQLRKQVTAGGTVTGGDGAWFEAASARIALLRDVELNLTGNLEAEVQARQAAARTAFDALLLLMGGVTAAILVVTVVTGRGLAQPIRRMTATMTALAGGNSEVEVPHLHRRDEIGAMAAAVEVFRTNAIARRQNEAQITHMSRHDALTELPNRVQFQERIQQALDRIGRGRKIAVMCLDLDNFKAVNDTFGHPVGDELLRAVARRLQTCIGDEDTVARLGGDEFAIVQIELGKPGWATALARQIVEAMAAPFNLHGQVVQVTTSIGVAITQAHTQGLNPHQMLRNADVALHHAKSDGRNTFRFFDADMDAKLRARRQIETDIREAVTSEQFEVFYQPLVNAQTGVIVSFEALLRWAHPIQGRISPADFIPVAEETGLIVALGEWALGQACAEATRWPDHVTIAVNLSPVQFKNDSIVRAVEAALRTSRLAPSRLEIEVTESLLLGDNETTLSILHQLRSMGVRVALDDFGTGYSSLSYLRSFPFDKLKIDQCFVRGLGTGSDKGKDSTAIVRAIAALGRAMNMKVTAEGVETEDQLMRVQQEGCTEVQGYLFSPPRPARDIPTVLAENRAKYGSAKGGRVKMAGAQA